MLVHAKGGEVLCLVEAKVVRQGNGVNAVREALGQLFFYRHMYHGGAKLPTALVALFNESVGELSLQFLQSCQINAVWKQGGSWRGKQGAAQMGLVECQEPGPSTV